MALDSKKKELATAKQDLGVVAAISAQTTAAQAEQDKAVADAQPYKDTVEFMLAAGKSGPATRGVA